MNEGKKFDSIGNIKKDASTLAFANFMNDFYHNNIKNSAMYFVNHNSGSLYFYETQYTSGTTLWKSKTGKGIMIDVNGNIK